MRIFRTRPFRRWMKRVGLSDAGLLKAVAEMKAGLIDADLGGGVLKKRIAVGGRGKRAGARTIVATNRDDRWFFIHGYGKNEKVNIDEAEAAAFRLLAKELLARMASHLDVLVTSGDLEEIEDGNDG